MSVSAELCLKGIISNLQSQVTPALQEPFAAETARLATLLLTITANGLDDVVAVRVAENAAMRAIFRDGGTIITKPELAARMAEAADSRDPGLRISELDAENARLRRLLIELHAGVEEQPEASAQALCSRIWRTLRDFETARAPRR
jgi:hypothetical protein